MRPGGPGPTWLWSRPFGGRVREAVAAVPVPLLMSASSPLTLETPFKYLPGIGPRKADLLAKLGLEVAGDILGFFPRRYEDRSRITPLSRVVPGEAQVVRGEVASVHERSLRSRKSIVEVLLVDPGEGAGFSSGGGDGALTLVFFNQPYIRDWFRPGLRLHAFGQVKSRKGALQMLAPEFELDPEGEEPQDGPSPHVQRIVPIYPLTKGLNQRFIRGLVFRLLEEPLEIEPGPHDLFHPGERGPLDSQRALHFPESWEDLAAARSRLVFDEYFWFASHLHFRRSAGRRGAASPFRVTADLDEKIRSVFPFRLTADQDRAIADIVGDLEGDDPMYRLLQGDVGTGKTAVALYAMLVAVRNGYQAALMAPTEVLAEQHHRTISKALEKHPVRIGLLTGSIRSAARKSVLEGISAGAVHLVVGTHAILQEPVVFRKLGLAIVDEQHRFGVKERMRLRRKGGSPHVLVMTATPIPRSLCLTGYGDLDLTVIRERPAGRKPVKTVLVSAKVRPRAMDFIRAELARGRQAYFVYPLIDESETLALPAAVKAQERLSHELPGRRVGLVHGNLSAAEKEEELEAFRAGRTHVLVATVVVEVGIDVPNATVLFLEDASRFGLAQLHQLRGRVGRGAHPGHCLVGVEGASLEVRRRLRVFASTDDGFRIAEEDLRLRGPGDFLGVRQSGRPHFLLGNPLEDLDGFQRVRKLAERFWAEEGNEPERARWRARIAAEASEGEDREVFVGLD